MDTSLTLPATAMPSPATAPVLERSITTKVTKIEADERPASLPADKPFVAQVVSARLSGTDFPQNPGVIAPPERTLRPYDVPMLPSGPADRTHGATAAIETAESLSIASSDTNPQIST